MAANTRVRRHKSPEVFVPRDTLVDRVHGFLCRSGGAVLDAMPGSGRHCLAKQLAGRFKSLGGCVMTVSLSAKSPEARLRKLRKHARQACEARASYDNVLLLVDGMPVHDEVEAARLAHVIRNLIRERCKVLIIATPVSDMVFELVPDLPVFRAADLIVDEAEYACWCDVAYGRSWQEVVACTHGIPSLVSSMRVLDFTAFGDAAGSAWNEAARGLLASALSDESILEERRLVSSMLLLGSGSLYELRELGIRVSPDIVACLAKDAPVLGLASRSGSFAVVPCDIGILAEVARGAYEECREFVKPVLTMLMGRGEARRAGGLVLAFEEEIDCTLFVLAHAVELVDAGFAGLVHRYLTFCRKEYGKTKASPQTVWAFSDLAACALKAIGYLPQGCPADAFDGRPRPGGRDGVCRMGVAAQPEAIDADFLERLDEEAALVRLMAAEADMYGKAESGELPCGSTGPMFAGRLVRTLSLHLSVRRLLRQGHALDAFRSLLAERDLRDALRETPSVFGARLQYDFELLRRLMEDAESPEDRLALKAAGDMLQAGGCTRLWDECECLLWAASGQARLPVDSFLPERGLAFARTRGDNALVSWIQLCLAAAGLRAGAPRQAIVRIQEVVGLPKGHVPRDATAMAFGLAIMALSSMGELGELGSLMRVAQEHPEDKGADDRRRAERIVSRLEISEDVKALLLAQLALRATGDEGAKASSMAQVRLKSTSPRVEAIALASLLCRLDGAHGVALSHLLPVGWRGRSLLAPAIGEDDATETTGVVEQGRVARPRVVTPASAVVPMARQHRPKVLVSVLGSFSVSINGVRIPESAWHRRNARVLLVLLALSRGHVMTRSAIGEALWPDSEYARARQNVYTAMSSLRSVLGQRGSDDGPIVGKTGRVWLDPDVVSCDVDEFESMARRVVARGASDSERIELCRRLDGMYRGGTVVAADDGLGLLERRHEEVSQRYVNALRSGVSAAIRLDEGNQAVWLAESAAIEAPDREDVAESLVAAYEAAGREEDAKRVRMKGIRGKAEFAGKGASAGGSGSQRRPSPKM